jgi:hypothetical protein
MQHRVLSHGLYAQLQRLPDLRTFTEHHVYAVWDFMCLLKALQRCVTCVEIPWVPKTNARLRRLINEIVLGEESDENEGVGYVSHFELYIEAMKEIGADAKTPSRFIRMLEDGHLIYTALKTADIPMPARDFVLSTLDVVNVGRPHEIAAAFSIGRENLIPAMFKEIVHRIVGDLPMPALRYYLERHITLDGEQHGQLSDELLTHLCGTDPEKWEQAEQVAMMSLIHRHTLWDSISTKLLLATGDEND